MSPILKRVLCYGIPALVLTGLSCDAYAHGYKRLAFSLVALPPALLANMYVMDDDDRAQGIFNTPARVSPYGPNAGMDTGGGSKKINYD